MTKQQQQTIEAVREELDRAGFRSICGGSKGNGFWVEGVTNPRTGSTWHSQKEAKKLADSVRA